MGATEHKKHSIGRICYGLVTVSDSRTKETDKSGALMKEMINAAGHSVKSYRVVRDDENEISAEAGRLLAMEGIDAIVFCGGTGISNRDVTIETVGPMLKKELTGFGEIFRMFSVDEIGSAAIMSRATAGVVDGKAIFCLPGSKGAVKLAFEKLILEECGHILWEARR